ncbi:MAG: hypothetical protein P8Z74_18900, partial [Acidobacteriota bacterium]
YCLNSFDLDIDGSKTQLIERLLYESDVNVLAIFNILFSFENLEIMSKILKISIPFCKSEWLF